VGFSSEVTRVGRLKIVLLLGKSERHGTGEIWAKRGGGTVIVEFGGKWKRVR